MKETRPPHVAAATMSKRLLLTKELLVDNTYEDMGVLELLSKGASLAGEIAKTPVFQEQFKPCLVTLD